VCVCVSVCLSAWSRLQARRISLRGEGNALYPVLSSCKSTAQCPSEKNSENRSTVDEIMTLRNSVTYGPPDRNSTATRNDGHAILSALMLVLPVLPVHLNTCAGDWLRVDCDERNREPRSEQPAHHPRRDSVSEQQRDEQDDLVQCIYSTQLPRGSPARRRVDGAPVDVITR